MAKYTGKDMVVKFGTFNVAGQGRNLEVSQSGDEIEVTTYGSTDKEFITGFTDRTATLEVLDDSANSALRIAMKVGSSASLTWYPIGTTGSNPKLSAATAVVTGQDLQYPYDDAVLMNVTMRISGTVTEGTAP